MRSAGGTTYAELAGILAAVTVHIFPDSVADATRFFQFNRIGAGAAAGAVRSCCGAQAEHVVNAARANSV